MSSIVLSAAVRQNLLSLQTTASQLAQTQNNLSTGNKVNSALDNPTNFFTASGLNNRASDISNLLDGISNGVQVIQAANTGITSVQSLVSQAKSIANQALQTSIGYSSKSSVTSAVVTGATSQNLLGSVLPYSDATITGAAATSDAVAPPSSTDATAGSTIYDGVGVLATGNTLLSGITRSDGSPWGFIANDNLVINGATITIVAGSGAFSGTGSTYTIGKDATLQNLLDGFNTIQGGGANSRIVNGQVIVNTGTVNNLSLNSSSSAAVPTKLGLNNTTTVSVGGGGATTPALSGSTLLSGTASASNSVLSTQFQTGDTVTVNGQTLTFVGSGASDANHINVTDDVTTLLSKIDGLSGGSGSSVSGGKITLHTGATSDLSISSSRAAALTALGLSGGVTQARNGGAAGLTGTALTIGATGGGAATNITFGTGANQISTLDQLNAALASNNLQATVSTAGAISISTTNDAASATIGTISGTATGVGKAFNGLSASAPVADATSQASRTSLVNQYNAILTQIDSTASDSSYNGINLLNGDQLQLTFNETGKSKLSITGVNDTSAGLGLSALSSTAFKDNSATNSVLNTLNTVSTSLRSQASAFGSNLSVVQTRQDFNKNLINVLQTGSANLTQADINLEAANSQALSTRQSLSISALSLANQSQQSVLQLLR